MQAVRQIDESSRRGATPRRRGLRSLTRVALVVGLMGPSGVVHAQEDVDSGPTVFGVGVRSGLLSANVSQAVSLTAGEVARLQYRGLTDYTDDTLDVIPDLATSWEINDDFTEITYTLEPDLVWSDGEPLTASDVVYTITRSAEETWPVHATFTRALTAEAIDERTVVVRSDEPAPTFPSLPVAIVPEHVFTQFETAEQLSEWDGLPAVGSGPYIIDGFAPREGWEMAANPLWPGWDGDDPVFDFLRFVFLESESSAVGLLERGVLDVIDGVPAAFFERLDAGKDIEAVAGFTSAFEELGVNNGASGLGDGHPALTDVRVRQALAHAIDRTDLTRSVLQGLAIPAPTVLFSTLPQWQATFDDNELFGFDPDRSRALLAEAGYSDRDGDGIVDDEAGEQLTLRLAQRFESPFEPLVSNSIASSLRAIGVETRIEPLRDDDLLDRLVDGEFDLYVWRRSPINDPGRTPFFFLCSQVPTADGQNQFNTANYCSPEFDELFEQQATETDVARRQELVAQMVKRLHDDVATISLFEVATLQAFRVDEYEGWTQQPAVLGPVIFNESARTYSHLRPIPPASFSGSDLLGGSSLADADADDTDEDESNEGTRTTPGSTPDEPSEKRSGALLRWLAFLATVGALIVALVWWRRRSGEPDGPPADGFDPPAGASVAPPGDALPPPSDPAPGDPLPPPTPE